MKLNLTIAFLMSATLGFGAAPAARAAISLAIDTRIWP